jgi:hypothetical protein
MNTSNVSDGLSRPDSAQGKLQRILLKLLREHERDDALPTNGRFLFYELVGLKVVSKEKRATGRRNDQNMHDALTHLREKGIVPWDWIVDETRSLDDYTGWNSVTQWATTMVEHVRLCPWHGRPPLVLTESRSLSGVLRDLAHEYAVLISATNGQAGGHLRNVIGPTLHPHDRVLYIGDFDWCGHQIESNTRSVLEHVVGGDLDWTRIALTEEQVEHYGLEDKQINKPDHRYKPVRHYPAVETEALKQQVIVQIIRDALDAELPEPLDHVRERERRQRRNLAALFSRSRRRS